jgi:hypothetical protein
MKERMDVNKLGYRFSQRWVKVTVFWVGTPYNEE